MVMHLKAGLSNRKLCFTHTAVHACRVGQHQSMDALIGADEDDDIVERLLDVDSSRQHGAVGELEFNSIVE